MEDSDDRAVVSLLDDDYARGVIVETYDEARTAEELADALDAAPSTVYERLSELTDRSLLAEQQQLDPDGHHRKAYRARVDRVIVDVSGEGVDVRTEPTDADPADTLTDAFERLRR